MKESRTNVRVFGRTCASDKIAEKHRALRFSEKLFETVIGPKHKIKCVEVNR